MRHKPPLGPAIGCDQGTFAARSGRTDSYRRPATPATIAASATLNTYQSRSPPPIMAWSRMKSITAPPCAPLSMALPHAPAAPAPADNGGEPNKTDPRPALRPPIDGVADRPADDEAEREGGKPGG